MIENTCALVKLKSLKDNSQDFIFGDPPYALGSTVYIDKDGKPKYKNATDFMNKWEMPDHTYWEEFFKVAEQKLKFGGRILFFGIDRQLFLFQYYAVAAGFEIKQSLYWYFISNFPKATDLPINLSKRIDKEYSDIILKTEEILWNLSDVNLAEMKLLKQVIEVGISMLKSDTVQESVDLKIKFKSEQNDVVFVQKSLTSQNLIQLTKNERSSIVIAIGNVKQPILLTNLNVTYAQKNLPDAHQNLINQTIIIVPQSANTKALEKYILTIAEDKVLKTENGEKKSSKKVGTDAQYVEAMIELKHTILSQCIHTQNLDTKSLMESAIVTNVIITKSTMDAQIKNISSGSERIKKYDGYKYSQSVLKQVLETVMVFQKRTKNKSILDDVFAFENGDKTISPGIWAIDEGRVPTSEEITNHSRGAKSEEHTEKYNLVSNKQETHQTDGQKLGRYPSQMFIDSTCASKIDEQSGELTGGTVIKTRAESGVEKNPNGTYGTFNKKNSKSNEKDSGGASRILHRIGYLDEELDLVFYSPKVSTFEREYGCGDIERKNNMRVNAPRENEEAKTSSVSGNSHPTLKPIKLIYQIAKLLKAPFPQNVFFPFSGAGSEIIGFEQAGFNKELFSMSELDAEFVAIAETRRKAWRDLDIENLDENKKHIEKRSKDHKKQEALF